MEILVYIISAVMYCTIGYVVYCETHNIKWHMEFDGLDSFIKYIRGR